MHGFGPAILRNLIPKIKRLRQICRSLFYGREIMGRGKDPFYTQNALAVGFCVILNQGTFGRIIRDDVRILIGVFTLVGLWCVFH